MLRGITSYHGGAAHHSTHAGTVQDRTFKSF
jgi:hypothetical protein